MEPTEDQPASIADQVADRLSARTTTLVGPTNAVPMVRLPPEFYRLQRESGERLARLEERVDQGFASADRRFNGPAALIFVATAVVGVLVVLFQVL